MPPVSISIEECFRTYDVTIDGVTIRTTVTRNITVVNEWIHETDSATVNNRGNMVVGFHVESPPTSFIPGQRCPVSIIQFCVHNRCLIFQIEQRRLLRGNMFSIDEYKDLQRFVGEGGYTFVGLNIDSDCEGLLTDYQLGVWNRVDLADVFLGQRVDHDYVENNDLIGLANSVLGMEIAKPMGIAFSDWNQTSLSLDQVKWAVTDAYVAYRTGMSLEAYRI